MSLKIPCEQCTSIHVSHIADTLKKEATTISKKKGVTTSKHIKSVLQNALDSYPDEMKNGKLCERYSKFKVYGLTPKMILQLSNVAHNIGVDVANFTKIKLAEAANATPLHLKMVIEK